MRMVLLTISFLGCTSAAEKYSQRPHVLRASKAGSVEVMNFSRPFNLEPPPASWYHRKFLRHDPMLMTFEELLGIDALRLATRDSGSMLFRHVDIAIDDFPWLTWRWFVEKTVSTKLDESKREGDDHPARIFLTFISAYGAARSMELVWGNVAEPGAVFLVEGFPHYVVRNNSDPLNIWHNEKVNLSKIYEKVWQETPVEVRLVDIAIMADSDNTDGESVAYFADLSLKGMSKE